MTRNRLLTACAIVTLALGLSACSSDDGPMTLLPDPPMVAGKVVPTGTTITLPADLDLNDDAFEANEGGTVTVEGVGVFECASATCTVDIADNVITTTGDIKVVSLADDLPAEVLTALADVAEDPPAAPEPVLTPAEMLAAAQSTFDAAQEAVDNLAADATTEQVAAAYGELAVAQLALTAAENLPENQPPPTAAEILLAAQSRFDAAEADLANLADDATPEQIGAAHTELAAARLALTAAENLPENIAASQPVPPTALEEAQDKAVDEAAAAMIAAVAAGAAAGGADTARADVATMQTNGTSGDHAYMAHKYAKTANDESMKAMTASAAAAAADDLGVATRELVKAEIARAAADDARDKAVKHADYAIRDAANELKIVGTVKSVGDVSIDADAGAAVKINDGNTVITGLLADKKPTATVGAVTGLPGVDAVRGDNNAITTAYRAPVAGTMANTFGIGKTVDNADDLARLMIVTQYAGSRTVKVFQADLAVGTDAVATSTKADTVRLVDDPMGVFRDLKRVGTYYHAGADGVLMTPDGITVAADAEPKQVYSYDATPADAQVPLPPTYVVFKSKLEEGGVTTYNYAAAVIYDTVDRDGDGATTVADGTVDDDVEVTATIAEATDYEHIHFGVWAGLGAADKGGAQDIADLGIGFVQNFSGEGLTSIGGGNDDMPNTGDAKYEGNWVAAVRARDEDGNGPITLTNGDATLDADFGKGEITATLETLATLTGDIAGNTFSGTKAAVTADNTRDLDATGTFTGTFGGGFYGAKAAEAGGVFDFTSTDKEAGEFRGAFGGAK